MASIKDYIIQQLKIWGKRRQKKRREKELKPGEAGWGFPKPLPPHANVVGRDARFKLAVVGLGAQGLAQITGAKMISGVEISALIELDPKRLEAASQRFGISSASAFSSIEAFHASATKVDAIAIATTAPFHIDIANQLWDLGYRNMIVEKPIDNSISKTKAFFSKISGQAHHIEVNYSRRWIPDYQSIKSAIDKGYIGKLLSINCIIGSGELAMIASHYFDFACYLSGSTPSSSMASLYAVGENRRGGDYFDPQGFAFFTFENGVRGYFDFSPDYGLKSAQLIIKGTEGHIYVDEPAGMWRLSKYNSLAWEMPFLEATTAATIFSYMLAGYINGKGRGLDTLQGSLDALQMIYGAYFSSKANGASVKLPVSQEQESEVIKFP